MEEARSEIECLPDEVLLMIFRYLGFRDLQLVEQVCERWKAVVETHFTTIKILDMRGNRKESDDVKLVKRCGPSLQALFMSSWYLRNKFNWNRYIAGAFPNLKSLSLCNLDIKNRDFRTLSMKCPQLKIISFWDCTVSDKGLGLLLKGLPGLQCLSTVGLRTRGDCGEVYFNYIHLGSNLEYLSVQYGPKITTAGLSQLLSKCKKLKTLQFRLYFDCDESFSNWCRENASVRRLDIGHSFMNKMSFSQISRLSLLEELYLTDCDPVDSDTLIDISRGCRNLRRMELRGVPKICDRGVKSLSGCRNLSEFSCSGCSGVTEESLVELGKSGSLKRMKISNSRITNSSCAAILGHCLQLEELDVKRCKGVVDGIVDIAIEAIENRANGVPVVLHLHIEHTGVDPEKETRTHPLLRVYQQNSLIFRSN